MKGRSYSQPSHHATDLVVSPPPWEPTSSAAADERVVAVLDAYAAADCNFIDTRMVRRLGRGQPPQRVRRIIDRWMAAREPRRARDRQRWGGAGMRGLAAATIRGAPRHRSGARDRPDRSLHAHADDPDTPLEETMAAFDALPGRHGGPRRRSTTRRALAEALRVARAPRGTSRSSPNTTREPRRVRGRPSGAVPRGGSRACRTRARVGISDGEVPPQAGRRARGRTRPHATSTAGRCPRRAPGGGRAHSTTIAPWRWRGFSPQPGVKRADASARSPERLRGLLPMADLELSAAELDRLAAPTGRHRRPLSGTGPRAAYAASPWIRARFATPRLPPARDRRPDLGNRQVTLVALPYRCSCSRGRRFRSA